VNITRTLKHIRQDAADLQVEIKQATASANALLDIVPAKRSAEQNDRLSALRAELLAFDKKVLQNAEELAIAMRAREDEIGHGTLGNAATTADNARPAGRKFAQMFPGVQLAMDGWNSPAEFMRVVGLGLNDTRLVAASMSSGDGSAGGHAVPPGILGPWLDQSLETEIVRSRAAVWGMTTDERTVPAWDVTDRSGDDLAGFEIQWVPELGTIDLQVGKIRKIKLKARKGAILAEASEELRADGLDFDQQLNAIMVKALSYGMDKSFLWGAGSNQPLGVFNSAATISVAKETGQAADTITYANLTAMFSRLSPASISRSVWVAHSSAIPQLCALMIPAGTSGSHVPVMKEANGQFSVLTRPLIFSEKMKPVGDLGDIGLFDFTQYTIGLRADVAIDRSAHVGFARDAMTYRLKVRLDGQPNLTAPIQPPNSAPTISPFVTLAARA
jgi:HK97 family phage major capsid protein